MLQMPEGSFYCTRNGNRYKWYQSIGNGKLSNYISKSNPDFAQELAFKTYLSLQLEDHIQEKKAIESYFKKYPNENSKLNEFVNHPENQRLLLPNLNKKTQELIQWMNEPYEKCPNYPEHLVHKTVTGELVRSKSESLIYMYLWMNHIPFRYDAILQLGQAVYYPDFTIRHPKTGEFYYWENFGRMDDPAYIQKTYGKLQVYALYDLIPGKKLITTFETSKDPLDAEEVRELVEKYFL